MKTRAAAALAVLLSFVSIASPVASASETPQRYLVATSRPFRAGAKVATFRAFDGFAADLTSSEVAELRRNANVRWVEPVVARHAFAQTARNLSAQTTPYGIDLIEARASWVAQRAAITNVVVIDTGIDYHHPELRGVYAGGYNFVGSTGDAFDDGSHGTHVAGTIAAANNDSGVVGVTSDVRLWGLKVLDSTGSGSSETLIKAVDWILAKKRELGGNWVANLSLGAARSSNAEREAFARGVAAGILFVAASGNESSVSLTMPVAYPAAYDGVVAVGAIDDTKTLATFSNQGATLDVVAPGVDVLSTLPVGSGNVAWLAKNNITYNGAALTGAKRGRVSGEYVYCGLGKANEIPAGVAGKIALIKRGEIRFGDKVKNAKEAGAIAVAIFNHDTSAMNWTLLNEEDPATLLYDWPVTIGITNVDGEVLAAHAGGTITLANEADDYGHYSGTSMASPHVAGAAALLWSIVPNATATEIAGALVATAADLGAPGHDHVFGAGLINVLAAIKHLAPAAIDPVHPAPGTGPTTGRPIGKRR